MIIQVRGTSGSGKSTAVRRAMEMLGNHSWEIVRVSGRRKPLYYTRDDVIVLGSYENVCGGCDGIGSAAKVYDVIMKLREQTDRTIICEGLLLSEDVKWSSRLPDLRAIFLTTPPERCLDWVKNRRRQAGNDKPLNPENTLRRVGVIEKARKKLMEAGVQCRRCSADQASGLILNWLRLHAQRGGIDAGRTGLVG